STALGEWTGYSNIVMRYSQGQINSIGHLIGTLKGGYSSVSQPSTQVNTGTSNYNQSSPIENTNGQMSADPIYLTSGDFYLSHDDIAVGAGRFPVGLGFTRSYNSAQSRSSQQLGRGWTHNFAYSAREDSSAEQGLGVDSAVDALPTLAAMYIARDILQASDSLDHFIIASLVQNWLADYLTDNVVDISA